MISRWSLAGKLAIGFGVVLLLLLVMTGLVFWTFSQTGQAIERGVETSQLGMSLLQRQVDHYHWAAQVADFFIHDRQTKLNVQLDPTKCNLGQWYYGPEGRAALAADPVLAEILKKLEEPHRLLHQSAQEINALVSAEAGLGREKAKAVFLTKTQPALNQVQDILRQANAHAISRVKTEGSASRADLARTLRLVGLISGLTLLVGLLVTWLITRAIVRPTRQVVAMLRDIAEGEGDLTQRLEVRSGDEIGQLAQEFNRFISKIHDIIGQVSASAELVSRVAREISISNQDLSQRVQEQASSVEETAATIEEMTSSIKLTADNANSINALAEKVAVTAGQAGEVVQAAVEAMAQVQGSSKQISEISDLVNHIAFQTNLLALNAAVEAARAGEAGKGFAVVASEVRALAQRSGEAAKNIQALIKDSGSKIERGSELTNHSGKSLSQVIDLIKDLGRTIGQIKAITAEQATAVEQINLAVNQIDEATQQNAALIEETASAAQQMSGEAQALQDLVGRFKLAQEERDGSIPPGLLDDGTAEV